MDEQALTELLECSVCLEQLDHSSKVLPCQHTFCRRCLDEIVSTKRELRCPECRTNVHCPVEELPSNILLIRLLEGLKTKLSQSEVLRSSRRPDIGSPPPVGSRQVSGASQPCAKAVFSYDNEKESSDLCFKKGDVINLRKQVDENWFHGELSGKQGFFPASYVQVLVPIPVTLQQSFPQCKALYDFDLDEDEKDCLTFEKDELLTVIRKVDNNWIEGRKGDKIGIFPVSFVELNDPAKLLMVNHSGVLSESSERGGGGDGSGVPFMPPTPSVVAQLPQQKRHSFTASSHRSSPPTHHQRRSLELSSSGSLIPLSTSSADVPTMPAVISPATTDSTTSTRSVSPSLSQQVTTQNQGTKTDASLLQPDSSRPPVWSDNGRSPSQAMAVDTAPGLTSPIYVALYNYKPQKEDEVELRKGDYYTVSEKCQDGWFKGQCIKTAAVGVFPGNYVQLIRTPGMVRPSGSTSSSRPRPAVPTHSTATTTASSLSSSSSPSISPSQKISLDLSNQRSATPPRTSGVSSRQAAPPLTPRSVKLTSSSTGTVSNSQSPLSVSVSKSSHGNSRHHSGVSSRSGSGHGHSHSHVHGHRKVHENSSTGQSLIWNSSLAAMHQSMSASANITPPNVVVGAVGDGPPVPAHAPKEKEKKEKKEKEKMSLVKRLTAGKSKKSKSPGHESALSGAQGAVTHMRSGSYPTESSGQQDGDGGQHKKTGSFDSSTPSPPGSKSSKPKPFLREKFCCIVPYPPQSELELELKIGDIVYVHRKREDGWFKGTLQRTGKTGLFPGSFVEKCE